MTHVTLLIMPRPKSYTPEQRVQVIDLKRKGSSFTTIMTLTKLSHGTIQRILEAHRDTTSTR
mgnify:CR=1 FL=1